MARRSQDIPIRPRYGITDAEDEMNETTTTTANTRARKTSTSSATTTEMASSYSEIPFLAQYAGVVPAHALRNDVASTATRSTKLPPGNGGDSDSLEDDEEEEDDDDSGEGDAEGSSSKGSSNKTPRRPNSLQCDSSFPYELEGGATSTEGEMRHFVAENLEEKLRNASSPQNKRVQFASSQNSTPSASKTGAAGLLTRHFLQTQVPVPQVDANVLGDIEIEAQYLAASVENLTENLGNLLHSISSITADNVEVHKNAVNKLTDSMDANIKCMYTIMAKTEEISKSMKPTEQLGQRIREIKRLVDMLDNTM